MNETKLLTEHYDKPEFATLAGYKKFGGYETLGKVIKMQPAAVLEEVKASGLRGRGGAGFPTGTKWSFLPKNDDPRYLLCNADEGEPGTFKDRMIMEKAPHQLIEGMIMAGFAINSHKSYIYVRGEYKASIRALEKAVREAYDAGLLGANVMGTGFHHDLDVYSGAGAYICGEETGLISSLEGLKGQPKLKPPFPAVQGYLRKPTIVNNVETLAAVTIVMRDGAAAYKSRGTEKAPGTKIFSLSGNVRKPGNYEVPLGFPLKDLIFGLGGGLLPGRQLKAVIPGGSSAPVLTAADVEGATLDYENLASLKTMLGSGAVIVMDDSQCMVDCLANLIHFYHHESCGQCTPCREGTGWLDKTVHSILAGRGRLQDIDLLLKVSQNMMGRTICVLSDAAAMPTIAFINKFRSEFEYYVREGRSQVKGTVLHAEMHH